MEIHRGRLIDHVHLRTHQLDAMKRFYQAVLGAVGVPVTDGGRILLRRRAVG
jgi:catechol-2,3-dioxygenase